MRIYLREILDAVSSEAPADHRHLSQLREIPDELDSVAANSSGVSV
jgi:hypothetical protein